MAMSAWWTAQKILRASLRMPFQFGRLSALVFVFFALPVCVIVLGFKALALGLYDPNLANTLFDPDARIDPIYFQHLIWLGGNPEVQALLALCAIPFLAWAQAVWLQGHAERISLRVRWRHLGRILGIYGTILMAVLIILAVSLVIPFLAFFALPIALFVLFRFAPVLAATQDGGSPTWRYSHVAPAVLIWCVVDFVILLMLLALPVGILEAYAWAALMQPGGSSFVTLQFLAVALRCLAWVYAAFVLTAMIAEIARKGTEAQAGLFR